MEEKQIKNPISWIWLLHLLSRAEALVSKEGRFIIIQDSAKCIYGCIACCHFRQSHFVYPAMKSYESSLDWYLAGYCLANLSCCKMLLLVSPRLLSCHYISGYKIPPLRRSILIDIIISFLLILQIELLLEWLYI